VTLPAATFASVAPPPGGLALAFGAARRRRNSKAAVSAFGGAVAVVSALSFLAPPGQSLVQEPAQPARGGLVSELPDVPRPQAPAVLVRTPETTRHPSAAVPTSTQPVRRVRPVRPVVLRPAPPVATQPGCASRKTLLCADVHPPVDGGPAMRAKLCPSAATVTVEYTAPPAGPTRFSASQTVAVGSCTG
jgi:hypothetical protein